MMTKKGNLLIGAVIFVVVFGVYYFSREAKAPTESGNQTNSTGNTNKPVSVGLSNSDGASVEITDSVGNKIKLPALSSEEIAKIPKPNLNRPIIITESSIPEAQKTQVVEIVKGTISEVEKNPNSFDTWTKLGTQFKIIGDYKSAEEIWTYVNKVNPYNIASFSGLATLYQNNLKNYPLAEAAWKQVIKNDPSYLVAYKGLFDLYRYFYKKDTNAAADILKSGISANRDAVDLYVSLASYYFEKGDKINAKNYYEQALKIAEKLKNDLLAGSINEALKKL